MTDIHTDPTADTDTDTPDTDTDTPGPHQIPALAVAGDGNSNRRNGNVGYGSDDEFLSRPVDNTAVGASQDARDKADAANVRKRQAEIHRDSYKDMNGRITTLGGAIAERQAARSLFALKQRGVNMAELENRTVRELAPPSGGSRYDPHHRPLGLAVLLAILGACVLGDYLVDQGAFYVLGLAAVLTRALAGFTAVILTIAGHIVGKIRRRLAVAVDVDELRAERNKMHALTACVALIVVALTVIRAIGGSVVFAALILGVGAASAVVTVAASYFHTHTRLDAIKKTDRNLTKAAGQATNHGRDVLNAEAREVAAIQNLQAGAAAVAARIDLVYAANNVEPDLEHEDAWIRQYRDWAAGDNLPFHPPTIPQT